MNYCGKCGNLLTENEKYCPSCGARVQDSEQSFDSAADASDKREHTAEFDPQDMAENKYLAAICYLGILFMLIAVLVKPNSKFVKFHANQSLLVQLAAAALSVAAAVPIAGLIVLVLSPFAAIALFVFAIMGAVWALQSRARELPIFGSIKIIN